MGRPVVIFDGECALCNGVVAKLLKVDRHGVFAIAGGNGSAGQALLARAGIDGAMADKSVVVVDGERGWTRSDAVIKIMSQLPFPISLLAIARIVPKTLRDNVYNAVARHRRKLKDADKACGVPPVKLRERWMQRLVTEVEAGDPRVREFEFAFDRRFRVPLALIFGARPDRAFVRVDAGRLVVRFGHFWVDAPLGDVDCLHKTGPYRWWTAVGVRESLVDHGLTFGSNRASGLCICFKHKVAGLGARKRHSALTVTVKDVDGLFDALEAGKPQMEH